MSDRIGVMNEGDLLQIGEPEEIYERPANRFVADFIGETNFVAATVAAPGEVELTNGVTIRASTHSASGTAVTITLRPEKIHLQSPAEPRPDALNVLEGVVRKRHYYGDSLYYELDFSLGDTVDARVENRPGLPRFEPGDTIVATFHPDAAEALTE
jgi:spermidine/putrescine transport system ATP-binding protein